MKLIKAMATVAGLTGVSRIAGFIRDIMTAAFLGAGPIADAFFVALKLPNFFRRVTAEGAFSVSFVPLYSETLEKEGEKKAEIFAGNAFSMMFWGLLIVTIFAITFMPYIIYLIAPGFKGDVSRYPITVDLARITFPYLLLMSLSALMGGMLNAHNRFAPFAAAPILFNLSLITCLLLSGMFKTPGHALSWGIFYAGLLQCGMLWYFLRRQGLHIRLHRPVFNDGRVKRLFKLMGPGVIGAGVMHVNLFADLIIASFLATGSISYLYYADRLNQLPLGMVGIAVGTALLPMLSKAIAAENTKEANHLFNRALEVCTMLALPAAVGLFMVSYPIVMTLFHHGQFSYHSVKMTTLVLTAYSLGMPAYIAVKVYSTAFWARQDTATPVKAAVVSTAFNIAMALYLIIGAKVGVVGIAVATAMAGWLQVALLVWKTRKRPETKFDERFKKAAAKIVLSCVVMGVYVYYVKKDLLHVYLDDQSLSQQIVSLIEIVGGAVVVYGLCLLVTKAVKISDIKRVLKK